VCDWIANVRPDASGSQQCWRTAPSADSNAHRPRESHSQEQRRRFPSRRCESSRCRQEHFPSPSPTSRPVGIRDGRQRDSMTRGRLRYDERCAASGRTTSPMSLSMQAPHQLPGRSELIPSRLPRCHRLALHSLQNWLTASASWADANSNAAADRGLVPHCINKLIRPSTLIGVHVYNITAMKNVAPPATTFAGRQHHAHAPQHYRAAPLHYTNQHDRDKSRQMPPINSRSQILTTRIP